MPQASTAPVGAGEVSTTQAQEGTAGDDQQAPASPSTSPAMAARGGEGPCPASWVYVPEEWEDVQSLFTEAHSEEWIPRTAVKWGYTQASVGLKRSADATALRGVQQWVFSLMFAA